MKSKIGALLFSALFMLGFGVGGYFGGIVPLWDALNTKWRAPSLVAVQATIADVRHVRSGKGSSAVRARYTYFWQGARYASEQISLQQGSQSSDNLSDWHERWFETLKQAQSSESTITAWIDPSNPSDAVLDKDVRWAKVWFAIPFATLFTGVGLVAGYFFLTTLLSLGKTEAEEKSSSKLESVTDNAPIIRANFGGGLFFFGVIWSLLVIPMCVMIWSSHNQMVPRILVTMMAIFGIWMVVSGALAGLRTRRSVSPTVTLSPQRPALGDSFRVIIHFPNQSSTSMPPAIAIAIAETVEDQRGSTTSRRAGVQRSFIAKRVNRSAIVTREAIYEATIAAPADGHASGGPKGGLVYSWTIEVGASKYHRAFSFPIALMPAVAHDVQYSKTLDIDQPTDFAESYRELRRADPNAVGSMVPEDVCVITHRGREWQANFPERGMTAGPWFLLLCAIGMLGWYFYQLVFAPGEMLIGGGLHFIPAMFGVLFIFLAMHFATRRFKAMISPSGLFAARASVLLSRTIAVPLSRLLHFSSVRKYSQTTYGNSQEEFNAIHAHEITANLHHRITPTLGGVGVLDVLALEMNDALKDVRQFGITPAPPDEKPLYGIGRNVFAWSALGLLAVAIVASTQVLLLNRERVAPLLAYVGASAYPRDLTSARFVPKDAKRHEFIMEIIDRDDVDGMRRLLADGIDANTEAHHGSTLLHMAVSKGTTSMVGALLEGGADVNRVVTRGEQRGGTPLSVAMYRGNALLAESLLARGAKTIGLNYYGWDYANVAAFAGCIDCLALLKRQGVNLDADAPGGRRETPIMTAAKGGKLDAIRWLAANGADLSKRDPSGYNVMGWAHFFKQDAAKALLLLLGADPNVGEKLKP
jgi:ankyrin repeat protein